MGLAAPLSLLKEELDRIGADVRISVFAGTHFSGSPEIYEEEWRNMFQHFRSWEAGQPKVD
jgi:hypothetical protein